MFAVKLLSLCVLLLPVLAVGAPAPNRLVVSENGRSLVTAEGAPFFYLADTAWHLLSRTNRDDAEFYLRDRVGKGFTVVQTVVLAELGGLTDPTPQGALPLIDLDPSRPDERYFEHVDWVIRRANELGLTVALLPTWGDKFNKKWGSGPEIFNPENARTYGQWLGKRYRDASIIWVLGGDRPLESPTHRAIVDAMAAGLEAGDGGAHLMTYHPSGWASSSNYLADADWLDFHMIQSGHSRWNAPNYEFIERDYARSPEKPTFDGEPCYENISVDFKLENPRFGEHDVRKALYWGLFAGGHGHTYGCNDVWQMWDEGRNAVLFANTPWRQALAFPGSAQMQHAKNLMLSRPYLSRVPDQSVLVGDAGTGADHARATRCSDGSYLMVYLPSGKAVTVDLAKLSGTEKRAWWFDPRTGTAASIAVTGQTFTPPREGTDWVLVIDDAARKFGPPGRR